MPNLASRVLSAVALAGAIGCGTVAADPGPAAWRGWHAIVFRIVPPAAAGPAAADSAAVEAPASILFGSIHYGSLEELGLDADSIKTLLAGTRTLVDEVDSRSRFDPQTDQHRFLPANESLKGLIGRKTFAALLALIPEIAADRLDRLKPWVAISVLESRGEIAGPDNLDGQISRWSDEAGLARAHLETLDEQMAALDCVPAREQAVVLGERIEAPWVLKEQSARVLEFYRARDLPAWMDEVDALSGLDARGRAIETRARNCLLEQRNDRWMPRLDALLRAGSCFVAVGAMHLTGDDGLLAQLAQRGYRFTAEPI